MKHMVRNLPPQIIVWDVEMTAWEGSHDRDWNGEGEYKEIIQIGAIKVDTETLTEIESFNLLVRPTVNPILSNYIQKFTGITQNDIDTQGVSPQGAVSQLFSWAGDVPFYSWGRLDREALEATIQLNDLDFHVPANRFRSIRCVFKDSGIPADRYMNSTIIQAFGMEQKRQGHNGLNDARTILDASRALAER